ncbi:hypothetical protein X739_32980 [Mesorhizobium sp. LNHC220B00]|nr:hypothetical protein [Mesorhizobium sp. LNHC220B00]ESY77456.1 hypothetical protein X739_32980 [Mesorhizobium sp. LNHC220B00]
MDEDHLYRSANISATKAGEAFKVLVNQTPVDLYAALAVNVERTIAGNAVAGQFTAAFDADQLPRDEATVGLGKRIFMRWSRTLQEFVCNPNDTDTDLQSRLVAALTGKEGGLAVIAGVLVASFGASPAVAAIVATLLLKLVAEPLRGELCAYWAEQLAK